MKCDFCSDPNPVHTINCTPFLEDTIAGVEVWSDDTWMACETCKQLIDSDKWDDLNTRVVDTFKLLTLSEGEKLIYRGYLQDLYARLREAMKGTA